MLEPKSISFKFTEVEYNYIRPSVHSLVWLNEYIKNNYGKYFDKLKDEFSDTNYYNELIRECANLRIYQKQDIKKPKPAIY